LSSCGLVLREAFVNFYPILRRFTRCLCGAVLARNSTKARIFSMQVRRVRCAD
jgi:hypothetical protein